MGTPLDADELDAVIRARVMELAGAGDRTLDAISAVSGWPGIAPPGRGFARGDAGARGRCDPQCSADSRPQHCGTEPPCCWRRIPRGSARRTSATRRYFHTWQAVSLAVQSALRRWIPEIYFRDPARYEDRDAAFPLLVYAASRPCRGRPRTEFTYDVADEEVLPRALHQIGASLQSVLEPVERRLYDCGRPALARRYAPRWHQDVLRAVQRRPRPLLGLLGDEAAVVNALVGLGSGSKMRAVKPFARAACMALRTSYGEDLRPLALGLLDEATRTLESELRHPVEMPRATSQSQLAA